MKIFLFNAAQEAHLSQAARQVAVELLEMKFQDPAKDAETIRRHAYLTGKWELLNELIADSYPDQEPTHNQSANFNPSL